MAQVVGFIDQEGVFHVRADCPFLATFFTGALSLTSPTEGISWCPGCVFLAFTELVRRKDRGAAQDVGLEQPLDLTDPPGDPGRDR